MIYGDPTNFAIQIEVLDCYGSFSHGIFNVIVDDVFIPGRGSNWTISLIVSWLKGTLAEIENATDQDYSDHDPMSLFHLARKSRGEYWHGDPELPEKWWLSNDPIVMAMVDELTKRDLTPIGIEIPFAEINDSGWYFYLFQTGDKERIIFSGDYGKTVHEKFLPQGSVAQVIRSLPE